MSSSQAGSVPSSPQGSVFFIPQSIGKGRGPSARAIPLLIATFTTSKNTSSSSSPAESSSSPASPPLLFRIGARVLSNFSSTRPQHRIRECQRLYLLRDDSARAAILNGQQREAAGEAAAYDAAAAFISAEQLEGSSGASAVALESCDDLLDSHPELVRSLQLSSLEPAEERRERFVILRHPLVYRLRFPSQLSLRSLQLVSPAAAALDFSFSSELTELLPAPPSPSAAAAADEEKVEEAREETEEQEAASSSRRQSLQDRRQRRLLEESAQFVERVDALQQRQRQKDSEPAEAADEGKEAAAAEGKEGRGAEDESRKDRPLRASIKLRQQQLQDEKRRQQEESRRRQQERRRLQEEKQKRRQSRLSADRPQPAAPASRTSSASSASAAASVTETAPVPPPSLSLPTSASASAAPSPSAAAVRPVLISAARQHGLVLPAHCYGYEWRVVLKVVDCVFSLLSSRRCSRIDWQEVAAMAGCVTALSARECRMLWRYAAYSMDDVGCSNRKRLGQEPEDELEADGSDIDVDLPAGAVYNGSDVIRASCSSEQSQVQQPDGRSGGWHPALDRALLAVVSIWMDKTRQAQSAATAAASGQLAVSSSFSASSPQSSSSSRPFAASLASLPSSRSDWSFISCVFLQHSGIRRSASFLQHRFALLLRLTLTTEGGAGEQDRQARVGRQGTATRFAGSQRHSAQGAGAAWRRQELDAGSAHHRQKEQ